MTSLPGRERTEEEFAKRFARAGLKLSRVVHTTCLAPPPHPGAAAGRTHAGWPGPRAARCWRERVPSGPGD
ncbi:hypothetical protein D7Y27_10655 [Corallococcus sp. AB004]|nr:hypothetical protein D7Y27_10655 [Corallococcus sp. AB004]